MPLRSRLHEQHRHHWCHHWSSRGIIHSIMTRPLTNGFNNYCYEWSAQWGKWPWPSHRIFVLVNLLRPSNPRVSQWPLGPWHQCLINTNAISIFIDELVTDIDLSMTPCYLNWPCCYFMIKLMKWSKAWSPSRPHRMASAHWIPWLRIIITSRWDHWSIPACLWHQLVSIVKIDPHGHGRSMTIIVDFETVQGKVMPEPLGPAI